MNITTIKHSVDVWTEVKNTDMALTLLTSGTGFDIARYEFEKWELINAITPVSHIYVYMAVMETEMSFWLVDSVSDGLAVEAIENSGGQHVDLGQFYRLSENTFLKWFTKSPISLPVIPGKKKIPTIDINQQIALSRNLRWDLYSNIWFSQKKVDGNIVQVFQVPYSDLQTLFNLQAMRSVDVLFALKDFEPNTSCNDTIETLQDVELILSSRPLDESVSKVFADVTCPCPPFCRGKKFGLLLSQT